MDCSVDLCGKPSRARGLCVMHYRRFMLYGDPGRTLNPDTPDRLWKQVTRDSATGCWEFQGCKSPKGYGVTTHKGKRVLTHRLSFYLTHGRWPEPLCCHHCDNPPCVNPDHLFEGDHKANLADMSAKGRHSAQANADLFSDRVKGGIRRAKALGRIAGASGEENGRAVLSDDEVADLRTAYAAGGISQLDLGVHFGISQAQVSRLVRHVQR